MVYKHTFKPNGTQTDLQCHYKCFPSKILKCERWICNIKIQTCEKPKLMRKISSGDMPKIQSASCSWQDQPLRQIGLNEEQWKNSRSSLSWPHMNFEDISRIWGNRPKPSNIIQNFSEMKITQLYLNVLIIESVIGLSHKSTSNK